MKVVSQLPWAKSIDDWTWTMTIMLAYVSDICLKYRAINRSKNRPLDRWEKGGFMLAFRPIFHLVIFIRFGPNDFVVVDL
jgi:hypothetical protein